MRRQWKCRSPCRIRIRHRPIWRQPRRRGCRGSGGDDRVGQCRGVGQQCRGRDGNPRDPADRRGLERRRDGGQRGRLRSPCSRRRSGGCGGRGRDCFRGSGGGDHRRRRGSCLGAWRWTPRKLPRRPRRRLPHMAEAAIAAAMTELHIDGTIKTVGESSVDADADTSYESARTRHRHSVHRLSATMSRARQTTFPERHFVQTTVRRSRRSEVCASRRRPDRSISASRLTRPTTRLA